jgi:glycoprotein endo-alpha-1,2-mannosidase
MGMPWLRDSQLSLADRLRRLLMLGLAVAMVAGSPLWESWGAPIGLSPDGAGTAAGSVAPLPGTPGEPELAAAKRKRNAQDKDTAGKHRSNKTNELAKDQSDKTDTPGNKDRSKREGMLKAKRGAATDVTAADVTAAAVAPLTMTPVADAHVKEANPNANYGTGSRLQIDGGGDPDVISYLRFTVSGVDAPVQRATLRLWVQASAGTQNGPEVRSTGTSWSETGITWTNRPAASGGVLDDKGKLAGSSWVEYDVTAAVKGNGAVGFVLLPQTSDGAAFGAREGAKKPQLVVTVASPPPPPSDALKVGAYYYAWYGASGRHWQDGYLRRELAERQVPVLGEYDSRSPTTIDRHYQWAQQYGVDFFVCSWWGADRYEDVTIRDHLIRSPSMGTTGFAILYESIELLGLTNGVVQFDSTVEQKLTADFDYLARTYFGHPNYLRIDGKPVVYLYVTRIYRGTYARALANLRATIRDRYGYELYLVGDEVDWDSAPVRERIRLFDAITAYTMYSDLQTPGWPDDTKFLEGVRQRYSAFKGAADAEGVGFIPSVVPAFNDRGVRLGANHYALPHEVNATHTGAYTLFARFLDVAAASVDPTLNTIVVTSWNEWHEDTQIEPTEAAKPSAAPREYTTGYAYHAYGFRLLEILRDFKRASRASAATTAAPTATTPA